MRRAHKLAIAWTLFVFLALGIVFIGLRGCTFMPWNRAAEIGETVSITVTRDFGREVIKEGDLAVRSGDSVMDVLQAVADVETEYGGGFVSSIEGLGSTMGMGGSNDWFYYVNGVLAGTGANQYEVEPGDLVWWDYHPWGQNDFVPAVVGCYPAPFTRGYAGSERKTTLAYSGQLEELAREIGAYLQQGGAEVVYAADPSGPVIEQRDGPVLALTTFNEAPENEWVRALLENGSRNGCFLTVNEEKIVPLNNKGEVYSPGERMVAAVASTGSGIGDGSPVWLVLCDGEAGATQVRRLLVSDPDTLSKKVGILVGESSSEYALPGESQ